MRAFLLVLLAAFLVSACAGTRPDPRERNPVVFVHGWSSSGSVWEAMVKRLRADGWQETHLVAWSYDTDQSNAVTAAQLAERIQRVLSETGASRVDIVSHSMGALSTRYYIRYLDGARRVDAWVSLAGPSHGTLTAFTCFSDACHEMRVGSSFLSDLNEGDETPGHSRYATWRSQCDLVIVPQDSPKLDGATNYATECLLHRDLPNDRAVYAQVRDWLAANEAHGSGPIW